MASIRTKICGLTSVEDVQLALEAGADAIGLVFYPPSSRFVTAEQAAGLARAAGPFVTVTGLFVDASREEILAILDKVPLQLLQFHGNESAEFCESFQRPYIKALRMRPDMDVSAEIARYPSALAVLLDAWRPGVPGGTGEVFDWHRIPENTGKPLILAGGLTPDNVALAAQVPGLYAVDVSGGVEQSPGRKDAEKIRLFINNARCGSNSGDTNRE